MSNNIKKFVNETIKEIQSGLPKNFEISDDIKFEISVVTSISGGGGLDIKLASGKIDKSKEVVQKIEFSVSNSKKDEEQKTKQIENVIDFVLKGFAAFVNLQEIQNNSGKISNQ
jgi:hypothetical protein